MVISKRTIFGPPPPPPINFVHESYIYHMDIIGHVAVALDPRSLAKVIGPLAAVLAAALGPEMILT